MNTIDYYFDDDKCSIVFILIENKNSPDIVQIDSISFDKYLTFDQMDEIKNYLSEIYLTSEIYF